MRIRRVRLPYGNRPYAASALINLVERKTMTIQENENYTAEYLSGFMFITHKRDGCETATGLRNARGQCITRGQFASGVASHGFDRACETFIKLGVSV